MSVNIESSLWPAIPEHWQELDAELTAALNNVPIIGEDDLSARQLEVVKYVDWGKSIASTAESLFLTESTVRNYRSQAIRAVGTEAMSGVLYRAYHSGLISCEQQKANKAAQKLVIRPRWSLVLKYVALGAPGRVIDEELKLNPGRTRHDITKLRTAIKAPHDRNGLIRRSFQLGLFIPKAAADAMSDLEPGETLEEEAGEAHSGSV